MTLGLAFSFSPEADVYFSSKESYSNHPRLVINHEPSLEPEHEPEPESIPEEPEESTNQVLSLSDGVNDFVFADPRAQNVSLSLAPVDVIKVEADNDGANFQVTVTTREPLPNLGPIFPDCYVCTIDVMADNDGSNFVSVSIIIDNRGWEFWAQFVEDEDRISYDVDGNQLRFTFPLDMTDWKEIPK